MATRLRIIKAILAGSCLAGSFEPSYGTTPLEDARTAVDKGDFATAATEYAKIKYTDADWPLRVEDTLRLNLITGAPQEAWRISQVAQRTRTTIVDIHYYRDLSMVLFGNCFAGYQIQEPTSRDYLLEAYQYRFFNRFRQSSYDWDSDTSSARNILTTHQSRSGVHFLGSIPNARLIRGQGCRFMRGRFADAKTATAYERKLLTSWYHNGFGKADNFPGDDQVLIRLLFLTASAPATEDTEKLAKELSHLFAQRPLSYWLNLSTIERLWLWHTLVNYELRSLNTDQAAVFKEQIKAFILKSKDREITQWLAILPLNFWEDAERKEILHHLNALPVVDHRNYLIASLAITQFQEGDWKECLKSVRRLLLDGESGGDPKTIDVALNLTVAILQGYRFSNEVLAAIQAALPSDLWHQIYRKLSISYAIRGDLTSFNRVTEHYSKSKHSGRRTLFRDEERELILPLVQRSLSKFSNTLQLWAKQRRISSIQLRLLQDIMNRSSDLAPNDLQYATPYFNRLADFSEVMLGRGSDQKQWDELVHFFAQSRNDSWINTSRTVRSGAQFTGVVNLRLQFELEMPYNWSPPRVLPLKNLLVMPERAENREWVIK